MKQECLLLMIYLLILILIILYKDIKYFNDYFNRNK